MRSGRANRTIVATLMEIRWSPEGAEDLWRVVRHIQRDNFTAARKVADTIYIGLTNLENFPGCELVQRRSDRRVCKEQGRRVGNRVHGRRAASGDAGSAASSAERKR